MKTFTFAAVVIFAGLCFALSGGQTRAEDPRYMAFCNDGDGPLTEWVNSRREAYIAGRDHERANRGHRWEVLMHQGQTAVQLPSCGIVSDGQRPGTLRLENTCGECRTFLVSRRNADGTVKSKEFTIKPNGSRRFRKLENTELTIDGERDCGN